MSFTDMELTLANNPCDVDPVLVLRCGHVFAVSELDQWLGLRDVYETTDEGANWVGCRPLNAAQAACQGCPAGGCKAPVRGVNRYGRLLAKAFIDATNKKFLPWFHKKQQEFERLINGARDEKALNILLKKLNDLRVETARSGPTGQLVEAALHALNGDIAALAALGLPAQTVWPRLSTDLLRARCYFMLSELNDKKS